ncbi:MAG: RHS repeat-associated core domain [Bacteroidetes bacterium]|nr:MAG: RHS repeat-associated core domain [Bacteroidota bacterium]
MRLTQGGKFEHGFLSGFVSSLGGSYIDKFRGDMSGAEKIAISAAIGGTAEALGGGKFANGAVTGAYVMALNHMGENFQANKDKRNVPPKEWLETKVAELIELERRKNILEMKNSNGPFAPYSFDMDWAGYSNWNGYHHDLTSYDINLTIDGEIYSAHIEYRHAGVKSSNMVTDIWPAGQAKYYGVAPSLKGLSHVFLRHSGVKIYAVAIIYFYTKNGYNAYLRYAFDYEAFKNK